MNVIYSILFLLVTIYPAPSDAQSRSGWTTSDYWNETQISFEQVLYGEINDVSCFKSQFTYLGCLEAMNTALSLINNGSKKVYLTKPVIRKNDNLDLDIEESKSVSINLIDFEIILLDTQDPNLSSVIDSYIESSIKDYEKYFANTYVLKRPSFSTGFEKLKYEIPSKDRSFQIAQIYNAFLATAYDPHTYVTPTNQNLDRRNNQQVRKLFGFSYKKVNFQNKDRFILTDIQPGSPTEKAGFKIADIFWEVNGKSEFNEIDKEISKETVDIKYYRSGQFYHSSMTRAEFVSPQVRGKLVSNGTGKTKYAYIKLNTFSYSKGCEEIKTIGESLLSKGAEGLILDLRGNGGGLVSVCQCIASLYLEKGSVIWASKNLKTNKISAQRKQSNNPHNIFGDLHNVVLVDGQSASASEALAIYLQAYRKAFIIGETTFGKGTMQSLTPMKENQLITKAETQAIYLGPHGISPQIQGVVPDITIYPDYNQKTPTPFQREKDRYKRVIPYKTQAPPVMRDRLVDIKIVDDCLTSSKKIDQDYQSQTTVKKLIFDQQLSGAIGTIDCAIENNLNVFDQIHIPGSL